MADFLNGQFFINKSLIRKTDKVPYEIKVPKSLDSIRRINLSENLYKYSDKYKDKKRFLVLMSIGLYLSV